MTQTANNLAADSWAIADLLRGDFKQSQYGRIISMAAKAAGMSLDAKDKKAIEAAVSWKNPDAQKVIKKIHKGKDDPIYGLFSVDGKTIEYKADGDLRDAENVALDPSQSVNALNEAYYEAYYEAYFKKEVQPHVPDAWIDADLDAVSAEIMKLLQEVHS